MSSRGAEWIDDIESRDHSPEGPEGSTDKRTSKKRKVLSCFACRDRKMKCDRVYPICGRCQKTGRANQCTYDPRLLEEPQTSGAGQTGPRGATAEPHAHDVTDHYSNNATPEALKHKLRVQERRIELLEQKLASKNKNQSPSLYKDVLPDEPDFQEDMNFRGKGFKTQFNGPTSVMSIIARYRELQVFTRETLTVDHSIMRVKGDFKAFRDRRKRMMKEHNAKVLGTDAEIFAALPETAVLDVQVALYFQNFETTYRVLHEPSFWREYRAFWEQRPNNTGQVSFAVLLILLFAVTKCVSPKDDVFVGDTTLDRQTASDLIGLCEVWNSRQPRKHLTMLYFQLQCLLLLAKRVNCVRLKQDWVVAGDLMRLALAAGMNRDPSLLSTGKISEFEKEMKRRLWVTIMELELSSSLENGLPSALTGLFYDTRPPSNLPDDAFSVEVQEMPASRTLDSFTTTSYLITSAESLPLRIRVNQLLNDPSSELRYEDIMHYDSQLHSAIASLPRWGGDRATIPSALLNLQLQKMLLILHSHYAKLAARQSRYTYSFTTLVDASSSIISMHSDLLDKGILVLNNARNDVVRVGLTLSSVVYENCAKYGPVNATAPSTEPGTDNPHLHHINHHFADIKSAKDMGLSETQVWLTTLPQSPFLAKTLCTTAVEILDRTRHIYEQKVIRLGTGYMEHWLLAAAVGMLPAPPSSTSSTAYVANTSDDILARCRKALDFFTTLAFRVLALQRDPADSFASSLRNTMASVSPSEAKTPVLMLGGGGAAAAGLTGGASVQDAETPYPGSLLSGSGGNSGTFGAVKEAGGPFDALQDMQVDMSGWSFPDFWAFDLGGDF